MAIRKAVFFLILLFLIPAAVFSQTETSSAENRGAASPALDFANGLYARKMYAPAISEYEKYIQNHQVSQEQDLASAYFRLADSYFFLREYKKSSARFAAFIENFPEDHRLSAARFRMATAQFNLKNYRYSQRLCVKILAHAQETDIRAGAFFYLAKNNEARGWGGLTKILFERLITAYPETEYATYASFELGVMYQKKGLDVKALEFFEIAGEKQAPASIVREARLRSAGVLFEQKKFEAAKRRYFVLFSELKKDLVTTYAEAPVREVLDSSFLGILYCDFSLRDMNAVLVFGEEQSEILARSRYRDEGLIILSNAAIELGDHNKALMYLDQVVLNSSGDLDLLEKAIFRKVRVLRIMNNKEEAVLELQRVVAGTFKNKARAQMEQGEIFNELGRFADALKVYESVLKGDSKEYTRLALFELAATQLKAGDKKDAKKNFQKYISSYPKEEDAERAYLEIMQVDIADQNYEEAAKLATKYLTVYPKGKYEDVGLYKLGVAMTGLKKYKDACEAFQKVVSNHPASQLYPEAIYGAAVSLEKMGSVKEAIDYYEKFVTIYPEHMLFKEVCLHLGSLYLQTENYEKAEKMYTHALLEEKDWEVDTTVAFWLVRYLLDKSDYGTIQEILDKLPSRFPNENMGHTIAFFNGEIAMGLKDFKKALLSYQQAVELDAEGMYAAYSHLGAGIASFKMGDLSAAEKSFEKALLFDHEVEVTLRARFEIANLRLHSGDALEAAKAFMMVAILYDETKYCPTALYKAGECFLKLGRSEEAFQAFSELKKRYPQSEWTQKIPEGVAA